MSTRANIKVTDSFGRELWFYKHSDGYPEGTMPLLEQFLSKVKSGTIRDNAFQASGWLIMIGHNDFWDDIMTTYSEDDRARMLKIYNWKVGSIEPTDSMHGDIEWLYIVDLETKEIEVKEI